MREILPPISPGELLDKLTILIIKLDNITDAAKRANVQVISARSSSVWPVLFTSPMINAQTLKTKSTSP